MSLNLGTAYSSIEVRLDRMERQLAEAERKFAASGKRIDNEADKIKRNLTQSFGELGRSLTIGLTAPLAALGTAAVKAAVDMDSLKRGLRAVAGSSQETEQQLKRLKEVAKLPGLGFQEAVRGSINLQAAGLSARQAERALMGFGNALATVGKGKAELDGVVLALTQIAAKGKVSAEEINQLQERVPQIRQIMKEAFGTADTEVLQKAKIGATEFLDAITSRLEKMPRVTGGAQNSFENFSDAAKRALGAIGDTLLPAVTRALEKFTPILEDIAENFGKIPPAAQTALGGLALGGAIIGPAMIGLNQLLKLIAQVRNAFASLGGMAGILRGAGTATGPLAGAAALVGIAQLGEEGGMSPAVRAQAARDRARNRSADDDRRIKVLTEEIQKYNRRRSIIAGYSKEDRDRLARQNQERVQELQSLMGVGVPATVRPPAGIDAAARARQMEAAKDAARKAKEIAEATARAQADILRNLGQKRAAMMTDTQQDYLNDLARGIPEGTAKRRRDTTRSARIAEMEKEATEERKQLARQADKALDEWIEKSIEGRKLQEAQERANFEAFERMREDLAEQAKSSSVSRIEKQIDAEIEAIRERERRIWEEFHRQNEATDAIFGITRPAIEGALDDPRGKGAPTAPGSAIPGMDNPLSRPETKDQFAARVARIENQLRRSLGGHLGQEVAYGFVDAFAEGLDKAFGRSSIGRIFARALSRWMDKEISNWLDGLFSQLAKGKAGGDGATQGAGILGQIFPAVGIGLAIGGLFKGLKFADGGLVPGPIGAPQPAIVHGGEFVLSRKMLESGGGGGVVVNFGGVTVTSDYDVDRLFDRAAWNAKRRLAVNPGTF